MANLYGIYRLKLTILDTWSKYSIFNFSISFSILDSIVVFQIFLSQIEIWKWMTKILIAKFKILIIMNTWDYKLCSCSDKCQKTINCKINPCGTYSHTDNCILLAIERIFNSLTTHMATQWHIWLHKILGTIGKLN